MHDKNRPGGRSAEYIAWQGMITRCTNKNRVSYKHYGGRGIKICKRWRESFAAFLEDMGRKPSPELSLDRIDNDGNYEPGNCRWTTASQQQKNKRPGMTGRPKIHLNSRRMTLYMSSSLYRRIKKRAKEERRNLSAMIRELLTEAQKAKP